MRGVDVSRYQGLPDWQRVKADGIDFAIVSTGDGMTTNLTHIQHCRDAQAAGLRVSMYHYLRFRVPPASQARVCRERWNAIRANGVDLGRLWLDVEDTETAPDSNRVDWLKAVIAELPDIPLGIYSGRWFWVPRMLDSKEFSYLPLWTAAYVQNEPQEGASPTLYGGWTEAAIWQWTSNGTVDGIDGPVDMNVSYIGDEEMPQFSEQEAADLRWFIKQVVHDGREYPDWDQIWQRIADVEGAAHTDHAPGGPHTHDEYSGTMHRHSQEDTGPAKED